MFIIYLSYMRTYVLNKLDSIMAILSIYLYKKKVIAFSLSNKLLLVTFKLN